MPLAKAKELREKSVDELMKMLEDYRLELIKEDPSTNPGKRKALKRVIARILTVINERKQEKG